MTTDKAIFDLIPEQQNDESRRDIMLMLQKQIRDIDAQLGSRNRTDATGRRLTLAEYDRWRQNAVRAKNYRMELYQKYKILERAARDAAFKQSAGTAEHSAEATAGSAQN